MIDEWPVVRDSLAQKIDKDDPEKLLRELDRFVIDHLTPDEVVREIHTLRGELLVRCGRSRDGAESMRKALALTKPPLYAKYVLELRLGDVSADPIFYEAAIRTALAHGAMPCAAALQSLVGALDLDDGNSGVEQLLHQGILMSWQAMRLPGTPPDDLREACRQLVEAEHGGEERP